MKETIMKITKAITIALSLALVAGCHGHAKANIPVVDERAPIYTITAPHKLALRYDVYAGGFHALDADLSMDLDKKAYDMKLSAQTQGFIGDLFPWKASFNTSGHAENGVLTPSVYTERSTWKKGVKVTEMSYAPNGKLLKTTTRSDGKITTDRDINQELAGNAVDLLTGTLVMLQSVKNNSKCEGSFPVFDGKRRFNITLTDDGMDVLEPTTYSRFSGEALRCILKVEPVAGFKAKDKKRGWMAVQNHTEARHKLPTIWLAPAHKKGDPMIPVRMEIASDYGSVVAHLTGNKDRN